MTTTDSTRVTDATNSARMALRERIRRDGFAFVPAAQMEALLAAPERPAA